MHKKSTTSAVDSFLFSSILFCVFYDSLARVLSLRECICGAKKKTDLRRPIGCFFKGVPQPSYSVCMLRPAESSAVEGCVLFARLSFFSVLFRLLLSCCRPELSPSSSRLSSSNESLPSHLNRWSDISEPRKLDNCQRPAKVVPFEPLLPVFY